MNISRNRILAALVVTITMWSCSPQQEKTETPVEVSVAVETEIFQFTDFAETYTSIGRVSAEKQVNLLFEASGKVEAIYVQVGDTISVGQALAKIESDVYETAYAQARSMKEKAERDLVSSQRLAQDNIISSDQLEMARIGLDNALAGYTQAKNMLDNTTLRAPFAGRIVSRNLSVGDLASPAGAMQPPMVLADMQELKVVIPVPEARIGRFKRGLEAVLHFKYFPGKSFSGRVGRVGLVPKDLSNNYDVEIFIQDPQHELRLGMVAKVAVTLATHPQVPVLPLRLVQDDGRSSFTFVVRNGRAHRVPLQVKGLTGDQVMVEGEFLAGDTLITRGQNDVSEGNLLELMGSGE